MSEIYCQRTHERCTYAELNYKPGGMKTTGCSLMNEYDNIYESHKCVFKGVESQVPVSEIEDTFKYINSVPYELDPPSGILMIVKTLYSEYLTLCIVSDRKLEKHELALTDLDGRIYNRYGLRDLYKPLADSFIYITEEGTDAWKSIPSQDLQRLLLSGKCEGRLFTSLSITMMQKLT